MEELYRCVSALDDFFESDFLIVRWFCYLRQHPHPILAERITGNCQVGTLERPCVRRSVNELLTASEVHALRAYLAGMGVYSFCVEDLFIPSDVPSFPYGARTVDRDGVPRGYIRLSLARGYNLSIPIWGYYDLRKAEKGPYSKHLGGCLDWPGSRTNELFKGLIEGDA